MLSGSRVPPVAVAGAQGGPESAARPDGFAYDPQAEEGPHPDADFEWWYHFGFLRSPGSPDYRYSFVSSFQRNPSGRYLFYNLVDLRTGSKQHFAVVDRALFGAREPEPRLRSEEAGQTPRGGLRELGSRLLDWSLDVLPVLPENHEFLPPASEPLPTELSLQYGEHRLEKEAGAYRAAYTNRAFSLDLTLRPAAPPMPVGGTGLMGLDRPEDQHYYTYPRVAASARLRQGDAETSWDGTFWYDHQWGKASARTLMKWCWWGLQLDDGRNCSLFLLQNARSGKTVQQGCTLQEADGRTAYSTQLTGTPLRSWKSPRGKTYQVEWQVEAPELGLTVRIQPWMDDHEIPVLLYGRIWEGPCKAVARDRHNRRVSGIGFQELIGQ
jgi:predicted secreted hydrolase